jgi:hypothetical protein
MLRRAWNRPLRRSLATTTMRGDLPSGLPPKASVGVGGQRWALVIAGWEPDGELGPAGNGGLLVPALRP